jgi:hypothetical protein
VVPAALQEPVGQHAPAPALLLLPCGVEAEVVGRGEGGGGFKGGRMVKGRVRGTLLRGERKGDHALGMLTHHRAAGAE